MDKPVPGIHSVSSIQARQAQLQKLAAADRAEDIRAEQVLIEVTMVECTENALFNPLAMLKNAESLEKKQKKTEQRESQGATQEEDTDVVIIDSVTKTAEEFQEKNPEMQKRSLLNLKVMILPDDDPEQILAKILKAYPDHFLADEAFAFLYETTDLTTKFGKNILRARDLLNERYAREVKAGRNMNAQAREFSQQGLGNVGSLRDLYRDITGNPREALTLFEELLQAFNFDKMKIVIQFVFNSIGSDLKSKGPSIEPAELSRLLTELRSMQAILGVYRFFFQRMRLIQSSFAREGLTLPSRVTFELLSKYFVELLAERYPSPEKILRFANLLGISEEILAQIIIFTQYRDAMRGVAPKLFKSDKHRQDLLQALIDTINELDDLLEEEEEEEEKKKPTGWSQEDTLE